MKLLVIPAIPYDTSGFREHGAKRCKPSNFSKYYYENFDVILNLGKPTALPGNDTIVYNGGNTCYYLNNLVKAKNIFGDLMPGMPLDGEPAWLKAAGYGGEGKTFVEKWVGPVPALGCVVQSHVEGTEYRVVTVGDKVVQVTKKVPVENGVVGDFVWEWIGVTAAAKIIGLIPAAKESVKRLSDALGSDRIVVGWDIIRSNSSPTCYLIEGNSAPGTNSATAKRIVDAIRVKEGFPDEQTS
jgi:hypothetical protein